MEILEVNVVNISNIISKNRRKFEGKNEIFKIVLKKLG